MGLAWLDIVDNWTNQYNMIIIGVMECVVVGWFFNTDKVWKEINRNAKSYRMPIWWFEGSIKFCAPVILSVFCILNLRTLFKGGGVYGAADGYPLWSNIVGGWAVTALVFASGIIAKIIIRHKEKNGFIDEDQEWD